MTRPRFTSAVVRGLLVLAEQAQVEEGRTSPSRRVADQRDRDRALEYLDATCAHRGIDWTTPAPISQEEAPVRSRVVTASAPTRERKRNALPEVGDVWEGDDGIRYLVREVTLTRTYGIGVTAHAVLRMPGGEGKRVSPEQWRRLERRSRLIKSGGGES